MTCEAEVGVTEDGRAVKVCGHWVNGPGMHCFCCVHPRDRALEIKHGIVPHIAPEPSSVDADAPS